MRVAKHLVSLEVKEKKKLKKKKMEASLYTQEIKLEL